MKTLLFFIASIGSLCAQTSVDNFTLTNVVDGADISLDGFASSPGIIIIFTSNKCPYDIYYTERIRSLITAYGERVPFLLVNAHQDPEESPVEMKSSSNISLGVPYLADKEQLAMNAMGAARSPEAFVLKREGGKYFISYRGAIDDNPQTARAVREQYLRNALDKLLAGQKIETPSTRAAGCTIRRR
jgi:hypothetical protein